MKQLDQSWEPAARAVANGHQWQHVDQRTNQLCPPSRKGKIMLDGVTANMLLTVYDALNPENQRKFGHLPLVTAVYTGWKLVGPKKAA